MNYLSVAFATFVVIVFGIYNICAQKIRWIVLLSASVFFYLCYDVRYIFFLLFAAISSFVCARYGLDNKRRKSNLIICIGLNVAMWFAVKGLPYWGSVLERILGVFGINIELPIPEFIVPVGISYFVLLAISYVADVYNGKIKYEQNFLKYFLYLTYFPTIIQGPISKYESLSAKLVAGKRIDYETFKGNMLLIIFGLIKKMVIADRIAIWANYCFNNYAELKGSILYVGALCYSIQLYMDFSGCVDICRGVSGLFGIELIDNFNAPYFSKSIKEFWGKWHISLSTWLKDYVYIPLGGNRKGKIRKYVNLVLTFLVSGIWHGAGLNYIVWGILQAVYQIAGECTLNIRKRVKGILKIQSDSISDKVYRTVITFNLTLISWIFFRSGRLLNAASYIKRMLSGFHLWVLFDGTLFKQGITLPQFVVLLLNIAFVVIVDYWKTKGSKSMESRIMEMHTIAKWACYLLLVFNIIFFGVYGSGYDASGFLYGGF